MWHFFSFGILGLLVIVVLLYISGALVAAGILSHKERVLGYFLLAAGLAVAYAVFPRLEKQSPLSVVPPALQVTQMIYSKEPSRANEFAETRGAFRVFVLPEQVSRSIAEKGLGYFEKAQIGRFHGWRATPVVPDHAWDVDTSDWSPVPRHDGVLGFLCHYGLVFCVWPDDSAVDQANAIAFSPGSYYAYDEGGSVIFVSPGKKRVIYISQ